MVVMRNGYAMRWVAGDAPLVQPPAVQARLPMALPAQVQHPLMALPESALRMPKRRGHAARPGTGPAGETCELSRRNWTRGRGSDVTRKDPACAFWSHTS
jgi:hypothetical protein